MVPLGGCVVGAVVPGFPGSAGRVGGVEPLVPGVVPLGMVPEGLVPPPPVPGDVPRTVVDDFAPVATLPPAALGAVVVAPDAPVTPVAPVAEVVDATALPDKDNVVDTRRATSTCPPSVAKRWRSFFSDSSARADAAKPTIIAR